MLILGASHSALAQATTETVAFQGRLTAPGGGALPDGLYPIRFSIYTSKTGGSILWTETQPVVPIRDGLSNTILFGETPAPPGIFGQWDSLWLEIAIDANANGFGPEDVFAPRTPLNAVPVAFYAKDAGTLGGMLPDDYAKSAEVYTQWEIDDQQAAQDTLIAQKADSAAVDASQAVQDALIAEKMARQGESYIVVETGASALQNGANLLAAYAVARALTPNGIPLNPENRASVLVPPGRYELGAAQLILDVEYLDLIGLTTNREVQFIIGEASGPGTGVLRQTANDVRIENLRIRCAPVSGTVADSDTDPAAYFPDSDLPKAVVKNCRFESDYPKALSMRRNITYSGLYEDCFAGTEMSLALGTNAHYAFGSGGVASGTFINCSGGLYSFGGAGGIASGTFIKCLGSSFSFGTQGGTASGVFIDCESGNASFGYFGIANGYFLRCTAPSSSFAYGGEASGTFIECSAPTSFGNYGIASGRFERCQSIASSFGYEGEASGEFIDCTASFWGFGAKGTASGTFVNCVADLQSFGALGTASGTFINCRAGVYSFGAFGAATGSFTGCIGGDYSFGGCALGVLPETDCAINTTLGIKLMNCQMTGAWAGSFRGRMENSRWHAVLPLGNEARIYDSTILGSVNLFSGTAGIFGSRVQGFIILDSNAVFNTNNLVNSNVD